MKVVYEEVPYEDSSLANIERQFSERSGVAEQEPESEPEPAKKKRS